MKNRLTHSLSRVMTCLVLLCLFLVQSCTKEAFLPTKNTTGQLIEQEALTKWMEANPISQLVGLDWKNAKQAVIKGAKVVRVPTLNIDNTFMLNQGNDIGLNLNIAGSDEGKTGHKKIMSSSGTVGKNANYYATHPPEVFFLQRENSNNISAFLLNFVPTDPNKEFGKDGIWTGNLYEWNMRGDTLVVQELLQSKLKTRYGQKLHKEEDTSVIYKGSLGNKLSNINDNKTSGKWADFWRQVGESLSEFIGWVGHLFGLSFYYDGRWKLDVFDWVAIGSFFSDVFDSESGGGNTRSGTPIYMTYAPGYVPPGDGSSTIDDPDWNPYPGSGGPSNNQPIYSGTAPFLVSKLTLTLDQQDFLFDNDNVSLALTNYYSANSADPETIPFLEWAVGYLIENPNDVQFIVQNGKAIYYTDTEMETIINSMADPLTGKGIELYLIVKYKGSKIFDLTRYNLSGNSIQAGAYTLNPSYDKNRALILYSAYRNPQNGIEYLIRADQLQEFKSNVDYYTRAADLVYMNGIPDKGMIQMMAGDRLSGLLNLWHDAIRSPEWWAYAITSFGHAITMLPANTTVGSTLTTSQWKQSMKNMTSEVFQGKTVTNPQGVSVTINIPDNYVVSIVDNGKGLNFRPSTPINPSYPDAGLIRIMEPTTSGTYPYPKGYVRFYNNSGQPYNPLNGQTLSNNNGHFSF
jgi:hypothetical protein